MSSKLQGHQRNYSVIEKKCLGIILALQKFHVYLIPNSSKITIYSDHCPLKFLKNMYNHNQRLTRWSLFWQPNDLEIKHIKGVDNIIADYLSGYA